MRLVDLLNKLINPEADEKVVLEVEPESAKIIELIFETTGVEKYNVETLKEVLQKEDVLNELVEILKQTEMFADEQPENIVQYIAAAVNILDLPDDANEKQGIMQLLTNSNETDSETESKTENESENERDNANDTNSETDNTNESETNVNSSSNSNGFKFSLGKEYEIETETERGVKKIVVKLVSPADKVDTTPLGKVDKAELRKFIVNLAKTAKSKDLNKVERIANHIFGIVRCIDKIDCLKFPFAVVKKTGDNNYEVIVNEGGVRTGVVYMTFPNVINTYTKSELELLKTKLARLYKLMKLTLPPVLRNNSQIVIAPQFQVEDIANELNVKVEDVGNVVYLINGLANLLYKAGYIEPEVDEEIVNSASDSEDDIKQIILPLDKESFKLFYKGVEKGVNYIVNAFIGNTEAIEKDNETVANSQQELLNKIEGLVNQVKLLESENQELKKQIEDLKSEEQKLKQMLNSKTLIEEKYNILLDVISELVDSSVIEAITNANDEKELEFIKKYMLKNYNATKSNSANKHLFKLNNKEVVNSLATTIDMPGNVNTNIELAKKESELDLLANYI